MKKSRPVLAAALLALCAGLSRQALAQSAAAGGPPPLPEGVTPFQVVKSNAFTWYGRFGFTNCAWMDLGDGVAVVDTGWGISDAANLAAQIRETTGGKPVKWFIMTHLHEDSNGGFTAFLPNDATVYMNGAAVALYAKSLPPRSGKVPTLVGVSDHVTILAGGRRLDLVVPSGPAHTAYDLAAYCPDSGVAFVGDLVTPGRCPMLSDPACDPKAWLAFLDKIESFGAGGIVPTRGNPSQAVETDLRMTREYLKRVVTLLTEYKAKGFAEARVAGELHIQKLGDYCSGQMDNANFLTLYRRMKPDGTLETPQFAPAPLPTQAPAAKPEPKPPVKKG